MKYFSNKSIEQSNKNTLVLCRTPFQAVIIRQVLEEEIIKSYDLVYLTQDNSEEDIHYFNELSAKAGESQYIYIEKQRFDIFNHIIAYRRITDKIKIKKYTKYLMSSIDNLAFRKIFFKNKSATLISFDDGVGHIISISEYLIDKSYLKSIVYELMFNVLSKKETIKKIYRHYSVYSNYENIMPKNIVRHIQLFQFSNKFLSGNKQIKFFIGYPFNEYHDPIGVVRIEKYVKSKNIDFYVKHPRETVPLIDSIPLLSKEGKIAEEAIFNNCETGRPLIVSCFSSVLFNISKDIADKEMILLDDNSEATKYCAKLGEKAGCKIIYI